jgi:hypothetical protein
MTAGLDSRRIKSSRTPPSALETNQFDIRPGHDLETTVSTLGKECDVYSENNTRPSYDGICMIDGCQSQGEEIIALLEVNSNANQDRVDSPYVRRRSEIEQPSDSDEIIPAIVCSKHFNELVLAYYDIKKL